MEKSIKGLLGGIPGCTPGEFLERTPEVPGGILQGVTGHISKAIMGNISLVIPRELRHSIPRKISGVVSVKTTRGISKRITERILEKTPAETSDGFSRAIPEGTSD